MNDDSVIDGCSLVPEWASNKNPIYYQQCEEEIETILRAIVSENGNAIIAKSKEFKLSLTLMKRIMNYLAVKDKLDQELI